MKKILLLLPFLLVCSNGYAFFCPKNVNEINLGATKDVVIQQCGAPDAINKIPPDQNGPKEWSYLIKLRPVGKNSGTFKLTITFVNQAAVNISVNGLGLSSTSICGDSITIGNDAQHIKAACGKPISITQAPDDKSAAEQGEEFVYNSTPQVTYVFINNTFTAKK